MKAFVDKEMKKKTKKKHAKEMSEKSLMHSFSLGCEKVVKKRAQLEKIANYEIESFPLQ